MLIVAIILSLLGIAAFVFLFARDFNIYWLILSPVIFAIYQFPAVLALWFHKKKRNKKLADQAKSVILPNAKEPNRFMI
jgi:predicted membrane protein